LAVQVFTLTDDRVAVWSRLASSFGVIVQKGELLVPDVGANRISNLALDDGRILKQWVDGAMPQLPHLMAVDAKGTLLVAEVNGKRVQMFRSK
jgi:hypothetical protein